MKEIVIAGAVRTAIGDFGGAFREVPPKDLARHVMDAVISRSNVRPGGGNG